MMLDILNSSGQTAKDSAITVLTSSALWGAILATILIIALGYILVKIHVFKAEWKTVLNNVVLKIAIPALCFKSFMIDCNKEDLTQHGVILGVSFAFYIILIIIAELWVRFLPRLLPKAVKKTEIQINFEANKGGVIAEQVTQDGKIKTESDQKRALVMWMMLIFGSAIFFGFPIVEALYKGKESQGFIASNIWTIPYRIFIQSYCMMAICGTKFSKNNIKQWAKEAFVNPIIIPTFIGLILWLTQLIPGASSFGPNFSEGNSGWFSWDVTMPYLYQPIALLAAMSSPLIWISIGMTLATSDIKTAAKDKWIWVFSVEKLIIIPLLVFFIMWGLRAGNLIDTEVAVSMVILAATPPATAVIAYSMQYKVCDEFAVQCSALTTLLSIIAIPVWVIISQIVFGIY